MECKMSAWTDDVREIRSVKLAGNGQWYHWATGDRFERFEREGEYCFLPWIRIETWRPNHAFFEAPLTQAEPIEFAPASRIETEGQDRETGLGAEHESLTREAGDAQ
jgi:hypothetical protein